MRYEMKLVKVSLLIATYNWLRRYNGKGSIGIKNRMAFVAKYWLGISPFLLFSLTFICGSYSCSLHFIPTQVRVSSIILASTWMKCMFSTDKAHLPIQKMQYLSARSTRRWLAWLGFQWQQLFLLLCNRVAITILKCSFPPIDKAMNLIFILLDKNPMVRKLSWVEICSFYYSSSSVSSSFFLSKKKSMY